MIKLFETGDIHIGKKYDDYPKIKSKLLETRFSVLEKMVKLAEKENCDFFVVTGDLFDNNRNISQKDIEKIVNILSSFDERVLVLPGNHDFYGEEIKLWNDFDKYMSKHENNIVVLNKFQPYEFDVRDEKVVFYPAHCQSKHSKENNLEWIKNSTIDKEFVNIGIAHGAIDGVTPDKNQEYFMMSQTELNAIPVDAWLIGHTHIPFPEVMSDGNEHSGYKIFNAGTHSQTDLHNNTAGYGFIIDVKNENGDKTVSAKAVSCGEIRWFDLDMDVKPNTESSLEEAIKRSVAELPDSSIVRLNVFGSVKQNEYETRNELYNKYLAKFMFYKIDDGELSEEITVDKIRAEFAQTSFASLFLEELSKDPKEMSMAYELVKECKE